MSKGPRHRYSGSGGGGGHGSGQAKLTLNGRERSAGGITTRGSGRSHGGHGPRRRSGRRRMLLLPTEFLPLAVRPVTAQYTHYNAITLHSPTARTGGVRVSKHTRHERATNATPHPRTPSHRGAMITHFSHFTNTIQPLVPKCHKTKENLSPELENSRHTGNSQRRGVDSPMVVVRMNV